MASTFQQRALFVGALVLLGAALAGQGLFRALTGGGPDPGWVRDRLVEIARLETADSVDGRELIRTFDRGDTYRSIVVGLCADPDANVRLGAVRTCGPLGWTDNPRFLALAHDPDPRVAGTAIGWMRHHAPMGDDEVDAVLLVALRESEFAVKHDFDPVLFRAISVLREELGPQHTAYEGLVARALDPRELLPLRLVIEASLHAVSDADADHVLRAAASGDPVTARIAMDLLPRLPRLSDEALDALAQAIRAQPSESHADAATEDDDPAVGALRMVARCVPFAGTGSALHVAEKLGERARSVAPALRDRLLQTNADPLARRGFLRVLAATGIAPEDVTPELLALRGHPDDEVATAVRQIVDLSGYRDE